MMTHLQKEFISGEVDSEEELRELKRQLAVTVKKFENEIKRARCTYDHIRGTLEKGILVLPSETNYAEFDQAVQNSHRGVNDSGRFGEVPYSPVVAKPMPINSL